jgi:signal transduction histidine kinase/ActR/RegA family two-component response regulator
MMRRFDDLPVQAKLATIVMLICSTLVVLMTVLFVFDKVLSFRRSMVENHTMLAETIAKNSTAALAFDDPAAARATLSALRVVGDVVEAAIYTGIGREFAVYRKNVNDNGDIGKISEKIIAVASNETAAAAGHVFDRGYLELAAPIVLEDKLLGYITIRADLEELYNRLLESIILVVTLIVTLGVLAQLVSVRLHRFIARPLMGLLEIMELVGRESNYSYRAKKLNNDEFGILTEGFNSMLAELEKRDEELARHRNNLEVLVHKRTKELVLANQQLQKEIEERKEIQDQLARAQRMEAIGTLAAGVAHDLNNILSGVVSYPELLLMRLPPDHEMSGPLTTIRTSGQKAAAIVQDLLTLARRGAMVMEVVDPAKVVDDYLISPECVKMLDRHPLVRIARDFAGDLLRVKGSPVHLSKTVMNLVTNAAEAMTAGGVITIHLHNSYLDRPVRGYNSVAEGYYVTLTVSDTGHGISTEDLRFIFEPFYTRKKMGISGTGLGMAVVWGAVQDHKGYIEVKSAVGEGTTFIIHFPATMQPDAPEEALDLQKYRGNGEMILVVDDVMEQRIIATDILRELGYLAEAVASGEEAVEYLKNRRVDLLVLDMIMDPGIDGIETFRQALQINPHQRALIASGYSEYNRVEQAVKMGVIVYLRKPYTIGGLARVVREELDCEEHR